MVRVELDNRIASGGRFVIGDNQTVIDVVT
jgi:hypothetical protein